VKSTDPKKGQRTLQMWGKPSLGRYGAQSRTSGYDSFVFKQHNVYLINACCCLYCATIFGVIWSVTLVRGTDYSYQKCGTLTSEINKLELIHSRTDPWRYKYENDNRDFRGNYFTVTVIQQCPTRDNEASVISGGGLIARTDGPEWSDSATIRIRDCDGTQFAVWEPYEGEIGGHAVNHVVRHDGLPVAYVIGDTLDTKYMQILDSTGAAGLEIRRTKEELISYKWTIDVLNFGTVGSELHIFLAVLGKIAFHEKHGHDGCNNFFYISFYIFFGCISSVCLCGGLFAYGQLCARKYKLNDKMPEISI